jgi:ATP-dependent RNA helicase RhlB
VKKLLHTISSKVFGNFVRQEPVVETPAAEPPGKAKESKGNRRPRKQSPKRDSEPWSVKQFSVPPRPDSKRFHDFALPDVIMHAIADLEFKYCTPIQAQVLEPATQGKSVLGQAQTGTGKTAAFLISLFTQYLKQDQGEQRAPGTPKALVIAPTRELVIQIINDAEALGKYAPLRFIALYGGMDYERQRRKLESGPVDLVAATPGRLLDFSRQRAIDLRKVNTLVIDEADRMLDMGFIPDVKQIIAKLPPKDRRQTMFFSATLTDDVKRLAIQWVKDPVTVTIEPDQVAVDTVSQLVYSVRSRDKFKLLYNLLQQDGMSRVLVFCNRRDLTQRLAEELERFAVCCGLLSGAVPQKQRLRILDEFREGRVPILVATDVAGRGIHVDEISHVINYDFPYEPEDYVHRIGRTGRAGLTGTAISFACEDESFIIPEIETYIGESLTCRQPDEHLLADLPRPTGARRPQSRSDDRPRHGGDRGAPRSGERGAGNRRSSSVRDSRTGGRSRERR